MRDDDKKLKSWVRSLGDAGFLDEVEGGWSLPETPAAHGATIRVDGTGPATPDPEGGAGSRSSRPTPVPVRSAKRTFEGLPTPPSLASIPGDSWAELEDGTPARSDPEPIEVLAEQVVRERVSASPGGRRITVAPATPTEDLGGVGTIVEELTLDTASGQHLRETVKPGRRSDAGVREDLEFRETPEERMDDLAEIGDYSGALAAAEEILRDDPGHVGAREVRERCRTVLLRMFESRLGPLDRVPRLAVAEKELIWRNLDPVSGFVLSRVDGFSSFEDIIDVSSLPRFETCRILDQLLHDGLLRVERKPQ